MEFDLILVAWRNIKEHFQYLTRTGNQSISKEIM